MANSLQYKFEKCAHVFIIFVAILPSGDGHDRLIHGTLLQLLDLFQEHMHGYSSMQLY